MNLESIILPLYCLGFFRKINSASFGMMPLLLYHGYNKCFYMHLKNLFLQYDELSFIHIFQ